MKKLLLLATMLAAATGCAPGDETPMSSNKQSYSVPFDPRVPPVFPASQINDEFRQQSPIIETGSPRKLVQLEPKWLTFSPGEDTELALQVDPVRQMALMSIHTPEKTWGGMCQPLPTPAIGEQIGFNLVTRMLPAYELSGGNGDYGPNAWGLMVGDQISINNDASELWGVFTQLLRLSNALEGKSFTSALADYAAPVVADGETLTLPFQFLRAEVQSIQTAPGVYESQVKFGVSLDGVFFQHLYGYTSLPIALRGFALVGQTGFSPGMGVAVDYLRYFPMVAGDTFSSDPSVGEILQLGSV
jgi:hypothetical protein